MGHSCAVCRHRSRRAGSGRAIHPGFRTLENTRNRGEMLEAPPPRARYRAANQIFQWDGSRYAEIAPAAMKDAGSKAIGVAACDVRCGGCEQRATALVLVVSGTVAPRMAASDRATSTSCVVDSAGRHCILQSSYRALFSRSSPGSFSSPDIRQKRLRYDADRWTATGTRSSTSSTRTSTRA